MSNDYHLLQLIRSKDYQRVRELLQAPFSLSNNDIAQCSYWATYYGDSNILRLILDFFPQFDADSIPEAEGEAPILLAIRFRSRALTVATSAASIFC